MAFTLKSGDHQGFKWQVDTAESFQPQPEPNIDPSTYGLMGTLMIARRECGNDKQYKHTHIHPHTVVHTIADRRIYATSKLPRWAHRVREDVRGETLRCETVWHRPVCQMSYPHPTLWQLMSNTDRELFFSQLSHMWTALLCNLVTLVYLM